jgi:hypothetical protein
MKDDRTVKPDLDSNDLPHISEEMSEAFRNFRASMRKFSKDVSIVFAQAGKALELSRSISEQMRNNEDHMLSSSIFLREARRNGSLASQSLYDRHEEIYARVSPSCIRHLQRNIKYEVTSETAIHHLNELINLFNDGYYRPVDCCTGSYVESVARSYFGNEDSSVNKPERQIFELIDPKIKNPWYDKNMQITEIGAAIFYILDKKTTLVDYPGFEYAIRKSGYRKNCHSLLSGELDEVVRRPKTNRNVFAHGFFGPSSIASALNSILVLWAYTLTCEAVIDARNITTLPDFDIDKGKRNSSLVKRGCLIKFVRGEIEKNRKLRVEYPPKGT